MHKALGAGRSQRVTLPAQEVASRIELQSLPRRCSPSSSQSRASMRRSDNVFSPVRRLGFSLACQAWDRSSGPWFLVCVGDICAFESADRLAAYASLVPAARDSGKRVGNNKRMRGGNRTLKRVFYHSAYSSLRSTPESRAFYDLQHSRQSDPPATVLSLRSLLHPQLSLDLRDDRR